MSVKITFLPEQDETCYKLELLNTQDDGGEVYVCTVCGYQRVFYWDNPARSYTMACSAGDSHRHCLSVHPDWIAQPVLSIGAHYNAAPEQIEAPPLDWEPRRTVVREGVMGGWLQFTIEAVETYGQPWGDMGGSCGIRRKLP